jgi:maltose alpha-D-glucosyltransferase/alpha-amylase
VRKRSRALSQGTLQFLKPENRKVLAFLRRHEDQTVLVVANLSGLAQHTALDLLPHVGRVPVELSGGVEFPPIGTGPYPITLGPHSFYWFSLEPQPQPRVRNHPAALESTVPALQASGDWQDLFWSEARTALGGVLLGYMRRRRWFGGKARQVQSAEVLDVIPVHHRTSTAQVTLVQVEYLEGEPETYLLPVAFVAGDGATRVLQESPEAAISRLRLLGRNTDREGLLYDALWDKEFCTALLDAMDRHRPFQGDRGEMLASRTQRLRTLRGGTDELLEPSILKAEQSNTSVVYGDRLLLKLFRRPGEGMNPELEMGRFLTEKAGFPNIAAVAGALEYRPDRVSQPTTLGVLLGYVPAQGDAWEYTLDTLGHRFEWVLVHPQLQRLEVPREKLLALSRKKLPRMALDSIGPYLESARLLGRRTAELHVALASDPASPEFAPEPLSDLYRRSLYQSLRNLSAGVFGLLRQRLKDLPEEAGEDARRVLAREADILDRFRSITRGPIGGMRIRCHGDYHLGQVLHTGRDFVVIDFEGEPARPLGERRFKRSPLRDVAGMVRSFDYATHAALRDRAPSRTRPEDVPVLAAWSRLWYTWVSATFVKEYLEIVSRTPLLPQDPAEMELLLDVLLLEKAVYEVGYELNNRPDWVRVPLQGVLRLLETGA